MMAQQLVNLDGPDLRRIANDVLAMLLPPNLRKLWLSRMGRMVIAQAKKNVREQKTVDGAPMKPRKDRTNHKKMLTGLVKSKWLGVKSGVDSAMVYFYNKLVLDRRNGKDTWRNQGYIANKHQRGGRALGLTVESINYPRTFDTSKVATRLNKKQFVLENGKNGCSANQAAMLFRLDFLPPYLRGKLPAGYTAKTEYLMRHVSRQAATFLIAEGARRAGATRLPDNTPPRPFLGVDDEQKMAMGDALMNGIYERFKAKSHANLLK